MLHFSSSRIRTHQDAYNAMTACDHSDDELYQIAKEYMLAKGRSRNAPADPQKLEIYRYDKLLKLNNEICGSLDQLPQAPACFAALGRAAQEFCPSVSTLAPIPSLPTCPGDTARRFYDCHTVFLFDDDVTMSRSDTLVQNDTCIVLQVVGSAQVMLLARSCAVLSPPTGKGV